MMCNGMYLKIQLIIFIILCSTIKTLNSNDKLDSMKINKLDFRAQNTSQLFSLPGVNSSIINDQSNTKDKYYQGSILFNFPSNNSFPYDKINLNIVNNFIIENSTVTQYISGDYNNKDKKNTNIQVINTNSTSNNMNITMNNELYKLKNKTEDFKKDYVKQINQIKKELEAKVNLLKDNKDKEDIKIKKYEEKIIKMSKNKNQDEKIINDTKVVQSIIKEDNSLNKPINTKIIQNSKNDLYPVIYKNDNNNNEITPPIQQPSTSITEQIITKEEQLGCMNTTSSEFSHFLMNYEKCKNLNNLFQIISKNLNLSNKDYSNSNCNTIDCEFQIIIKFKSDQTEIILLQKEENKINSIKAFTISTPIFIITINNKRMKEMSKDLIRDLTTVYLYQPLTKLLKIVPEYSKSQLIVIAEGLYYETMEDSEKQNFIRSILSLQTIDDRFNIDWNNVRVINHKEKKLNDYLLIEKNLNQNALTLNFDQNGISMMGQDNTSNQSSLDSSLNPVESSSIQIQNGEDKENIYEKNLNVITMDTILNQFGKIEKKRKLLNENNLQRHHIKNINSYTFKSIPIKEDSLISKKEKLQKINLDSISPKLKKLLNDPTIIKLKNKILDDYLENENKLNFRFKEKLNNEMNNENNINQNPCFNKGFYDKDLNIIGSGNFTLCYKYIELNFNTENNFTLFKNITIPKEIKITHDEIQNSKIILGREYRNYKYLFYEKKGLNMFKYNEEIKFSKLKEKINKICSMQYSHLIAELSKFNIKNFSKLCFDLTYFTINLEKNGVNGNYTLIIKTHLKSEYNSNNNEKSILAILTQKNNFTIFITFISLSTINLILLIFINNISNTISSFITKTNERFYCKLIPSDKEVEEILNYQKVKLFLFYEENSHFRIKFGKSFNYENADKIMLYAEVKEIYSESVEFRKIVKENRKYFLELKICIMANMIQIILLMCIIVCLFVIIQKIQLEFGIIKAITTFSSFLFVIILIFICYRISTNYDIIVEK